MCESFLYKIGGANAHDDPPLLDVRASMSIKDPLQEPRKASVCRNCSVAWHLLPLSRLAEAQMILWVPRLAHFRPYDSSRVLGQDQLSSFLLAPFLSTIILHQEYMQASESVESSQSIWATRFIRIGHVQISHCARRTLTGFEVVRTQKECSEKFFLQASPFLGEKS